MPSLTPTVLLDAVIIIGGTTISEHGNKLELPVTVEVLETTAFGQTFKTRVGGLKDGQLSVTLFNDFSASNLDSLFWPWLGTNQTFEVKPTSAARGATNPSYTGSILISQWTPITGSVGDLVSLDMSYPTSGVISRLIV